MTTSEKDILFIVPARSGSKRIVDKNVRLLAGRSLIARTADVIASSGFNDCPCLLSTDDERMAAEGLRLGWIVPWLRPAELATDNASTIDVVFHALEWWKLDRGGYPAFTVLLQATTPFREPQSIADAIRLLKNHTEIDAVVGVSELNRTGNTLFRLNDVGHLVPMESKPSFGHLLTPNGSLYAIRTDALQRERTFFPKATTPLTMDSVYSLDIDTPADWLIAEALASKLDQNIRTQQ